jgi:hypothetical protein
MMSSKVTWLSRFRWFQEQESEKQSYKIRSPYIGSYPNMVKSSYNDGDIDNTLALASNILQFQVVTYKAHTPQL